MACLIAPAAAAIVTTGIRKKIDPKYHIEWLNLMLWGGSVMLIIDHVINGEIVFYPPFLTADISKISFEILTIGVPMTFAIFAVWIIMIIVANKKNEKSSRIPA